MVVDPSPSPALSPPPSMAPASSPVASTAVPVPPPTTSAAASGWTPEVIVALVVGAIAAALSVVSIVQTWLIWRRDGPLFRVEMLPAVGFPNGECLIAMRLEDVPSPPVGAEEMVAVSVYSVGRQPVHLAHLHFVGDQRLRKRVLDWFWRLWARVYRRAKDRRGHAVFVPQDGHYAGKSRPGGRVDVAEGKTFLFHVAPLQDLARMSRGDGNSGRVRAWVVLGNGTVMKSKPYSVMNPPKSAVMDAEST